MTEASPGEPAPLIGSVTLSGNVTAAHTDAEWRDVVVCGPGGYQWRPSLGSKVLVIKDPNGKRPYAVAECSGKTGELAEGEILISTGQASIRMSADGTIHLSGAVIVNGSPI